MKPIAIIAVLWMAGCGLIPQSVMVQPLQGDDHVLEMTVLCDTFGMIGDFCLEFNNARRYDIKYARSDPTLADFKYLVTDADTIKIDDKRSSGNTVSIDKPAGENIEFRIENLSQTTLEFIDGEDIVRKLWIKRIEGSKEKDTNVSFYQDSGEPHISFGENSIIYLENYYSHPEWILELQGDFQIQIKGENNNIEPIKNMNEARITFTGSLIVESPKAPRADFLCLGFEFHDNIKVLSSGKGQIVVSSEARSAQETTENQFIEVIEDSFRIDMTKEFYRTDDYLKNLHLKNIEKMQIEEIRESYGRLMIKTGKIYYGGETLFPKIEITTRYFSADKQTEEEGNYLVELTNTEVTRSEVEFLEGNQYTVEIHIQKLVEDGIKIDLEDKNCHFFVPFEGEKILKNIDLEDPEFRHHYKFIVIPGCSHLSGQIRCFTDVSYRKKSEEPLKSPYCETRSFTAVVSAGIYFIIQPGEDPKPTYVNENRTFTIERKISLDSETSSPVTVKAFLILEKGFEVESGTPYASNKLMKDGEPLDFKVNIRTPMIEKNEELYKVKVLVFYKMAESDYYTLYLPDPTKDETVVIDVIVERSSGLFERNPAIQIFSLSFAAGVCATATVSLSIGYLRKKKSHLSRKKKSRSSPRKK